MAREVGHSLGLLDNFGASSTYPVDSLRNAAFTHANGLAASLLSGVNFNYVAQTADRGVRLMPTAPGVYDQYAIEWNYRYFDPQRVSAQEEAAELEKWVDQRVKNPRLRYFRTSSQRWDPRVQEGALGNNALRAANYGIANLCQIEKHLYDWVKNDEDSRIKEKLYLTIAQQHYAYFKRVMSNVGGILLNDMKFSSGVPRYQVVDKDLQRKSLQWCLWQAKRFKSYADKNFERRGFISGATPISCSSSSATTCSELAPAWPSRRTSPRRVIRRKNILPTSSMAFSKVSSRVRLPRRRNEFCNEPTSPTRVPLSIKPTSKAETVRQLYRVRVLCRRIFRKRISCKSISYPPSPVSPLPRLTATLTPRSLPR